MPTPSKIETKPLTKQDVLNMDQIIVKDLLIRTVIGIFDWERKIKQDVLINLTVYHPIQNSPETDTIETTKNYKHITKSIITFTESSSFELIETLAEEIAKLLIKTFNIYGVSIKIEKPHALRFSKSVGVKITRFNKSIL